MENPYALALDGLEIPNPVEAFFRFCREREAVRLRREAGEPPPLTDDVILQKGRFLNVFREDDRGSKAVRRFCEPAAKDLPRLIHALFFARWCNQAETLDALDVALLENPDALDARLAEFGDAWCSEAYPVVDVTWRGHTYERREAAVRLLPEIGGFLVREIEAAGGDVARATTAINRTLAMTNDFPIFMAVIDVSWFRPDVVSPNSPVPSGIGAAPYLDRLQAHLGTPDHHATMQRMIELAPRHFPDAKRAFTPVDIEYLACECRKYHSYVNGTRTFDGRNAFQPRD